MQNSVGGGPVESQPNIIHGFADAGEHRETKMKKKNERDFNGEASAVSSEANDGKWARMPKAGETLRALSRSYLYCLVDQDLIESISLRQPGKKRGVRLIHLPSLDAYLERQLAEQSNEKKGSGK